MSGSSQCLVLGLIVGETALAQAFLELAKDTFAEFSGREPDTSSDVPTLTTVILCVAEQRFHDSDMSTPLMCQCWGKMLPVQMAVVTVYCVLNCVLRAT